MNQIPSQGNHDPAEIARFEASAQRWWDKEGEFKPLHDINPVRVDYIAQRLAAKILDIGCGGGLVCEALATRGAQVTGIDLGATAIDVAKLHALESGLAITYRCEAAETHASQRAGHYDVVTCLEMLEHVPDPLSVIHSAALLVKPGGQVFFSTINRTLKAYAMAIVGAEYVLRLLPTGTHTYERFIRPSELGRWSRAEGLELLDVAGLDYQPLTQQCKISADPSVNYIVHTRRGLS
jgi:2-polyprenyl-6-hydroxyphenyl methylase/3-demethylubiquinone-9 3-methyltransferase